MIDTTASLRRKISSAGDSEPPSESGGAAVRNGLSADPVRASDRVAASALLVRPRVGVRTRFLLMLCRT
jgi:hypothetical protein